MPSSGDQIQPTLNGIDFTLHRAYMAGGQRAEQSTVPNRLQRKMFPNGILFLLEALIQRFPLCYILYFLMNQVALEANKHFS